MKIQIKNLKPNPYRDVKNYPYNQEKIQNLKDSINQTGFWDNILARKVNGDIQIAYGHHRLAALKQVKNPTDEIDIPVKELSDALMIKIMANENNNDWGTNIIVTDETVRVTSQFLEGHPDEVKTAQPGRGRDYHNSPEAFKISEFLNWSEAKVYYSLERLGMIKSGKIEKDVIESMPHEKAAKRFVSAVKKNPEITIEKQRTIADKLHKEDSFSERSINDEFLTEKWNKPEKKTEFKSKEIKDFENFIGELRDKTQNLFEDLRKFARLENEIGDYNKTVYRKLLNLSLITLSKQINLIIKTKENEKTEFTNNDSPSIGE